MMTNADIQRAMTFAARARDMAGAVRKAASTSPSQNAVYEFADAMRDVAVDCVAKLQNNPTSKSLLPELRRLSQAYPTLVTLYKVLIKGSRIQVPDASTLNMLRAGLTPPAPPSKTAVHQAIQRTPVQLTPLQQMYRQQMQHTVPAPTGGGLHNGGNGGVTTPANPDQSSNPSPNGANAFGMAGNGGGRNGGGDVGGGFGGGKGIGAGGGGAGGPDPGGAGSGSGAGNSQNGGVGAQAGGAAGDARGAGMSVSGGATGLGEQAGSSISGGSAGSWAASGIGSVGASVSGGAESLGEQLGNSVSKDAGAPGGAAPGSIGADAGDPAPNAGDAPGQQPDPGQSPNGDGEGGDDPNNAGTPAAGSGDNDGTAAPGGGGGGMPDPEGDDGGESARFGGMRYRGPRRANTFSNRDAAGAGLSSLGRLLQFTSGYIGDDGGGTNPRFDPGAQGSGDGGQYADPSSGGGSTGGADPEDSHAPTPPPSNPSGWGDDYRGGNNPHYMPYSSTQWTPYSGSSKANLQKVSFAIQRTVMVRTNIR